MVLVYCVFEKCGNQRKKNSKISFFSFPKEEDLLQKWLTFVNKHNQTKLDEKLLERDKMKICHMHFEKRQVQTKSNNDRALLRNSVPRCPPGIVDKAHALKKPKPKKKPKKSKAADSSKSRKSTETSPGKPKETQLALDGNPLYHTINGYVVDLRIAAQQDTFRLPNGKLIQVRRQPKKGSETGTGSTAQPESTEVAKSTAPVSPSAEKSNSETHTSDKPNAAKTASPRLSAQNESDLRLPPTNAHTEKPSKTYTNRRTLNQPPRPSPSFRSVPLSTQPLSSATMPSSPQVMPYQLPSPETPSQLPPPVTPRPPTATPTPSAQTKRTAVILQPSLTTLQALIHKTHPDTPFGNHLTEFENRLISTAELSLHVVSKINNFLHSNPYRNAEDTRDLKDLYHHVAYILKYAVDRFKGLEDNCIQDIQKMGFTKQSDLGPLLSEKTDKAPPKSSEMKETAVAQAETEAEEEEDDDCAIIEERTDVIEVDSDDEDESGEEEESDDQTAEPAGITLNPKQLRICSDTESICHDEASNDSERGEKVRRNTSSERQAQVESTEQPIAIETHIEEATHIEVVTNEVEETTIVQDFYYAEVSEDDDEDEDGETMEQPNQGNDEIMDLDDDEASSEQGTQEGGEETEELIEIIEGDIDLELEDGQEYKVIEVIDADYEMW